MVSKTQDSSPGAWSNTLRGVGIGRYLFTVEKNGDLCRTDTKTKNWETIGQNYKTKYLIAGGTDEGYLFAIEKDGNLYAVDPESGDFELVGQDNGFWKDTVAADAVDTTMYTIEKDGTLYKTNLKTVEYEKIGDGYEAKEMWYWQGYLYILEIDGDLYKTDAETGEWVQFGDPNAYAETVAATVHNGMLYTVDGDGTFGWTNLENGDWTENSDEDFSEVRKLFSANDNLYAIEKDGTLYRIDID